MHRALELAQLGRGFVSPNPMVGCVIECNGKIIGEGHHQKYGEAHAEVNAINSVENRDLLSSSTLYVTLEPCAHHGKTPPCADLIVNKGLKKVVIACRDPFEEVDGRGIEKIENAGIEVEFGLLEKDATNLNSRFFSFHQKKRPYVILKWAETADGFIARENGDAKWISNEYSRQLLHKWRTEEDAILVGKNTAIHDNPSLTARDYRGKNPIRVILDSNLEAPASHKLFNDDANTLIFNTIKKDTNGSNQWTKKDLLNPQVILTELYKQNIQSVIVEGGTQVLNSFLRENCWDEVRVFKSDTKFEQGIKAPELAKDRHQSMTIQNDQLHIFKNHG